MPNRETRRRSGRSRPPASGPTSAAATSGRRATVRKRRDARRAGWRRVRSHARSQQEGPRERRRRPVAEPWRVSEPIVRSTFKRVSGAFVTGFRLSLAFVRLRAPGFLERLGLVERLLVGAKRRRVAGPGHVVARGQLALKEARGLKLVETGQLVDRLKPKLNEE